MQRRLVIPPNPFPLNLEPGSEAPSARALHFLGKPVRAHPTPVRDLAAIDAHAAAAAPDEHRAELMLRPDSIELRLVLKLEQKVQRTLEAQLLVQPPASGLLHGLRPPRMAAATVRPVVRPQPLAARAALQQQLAAVVENEQRERAMQDTPPFVAARLAHIAHLPVGLVHQDERLGLGRIVAASPQSGLSAACRDHQGTPGRRPNVYHVRNSWT